MSSKSNTIILATAGYDHTIRFWEAPTGICYRTVQYEDSQVNCLEITPDKQYLTAAGNPHVRLYEIQSNNPNPLTSYDGHRGNVTSVGFQKDGKWMFTSSEDGTMKIWDLRARGCQKNYECKAPINTAVLHPDQSQLLAGDQNGNIRIWDLVADKCTTKMTPAGEVGIRSVAISCNGDKAVVCNSHGTCLVFKSLQSEIFEKEHEFKAHDSYILKCKISNDCKYIATCSSDRTAKIWNMSDYTEHSILYSHQQKWVWDCCFSADSSYLITASSDGQARLWDLSNGEIVRQYSGNQKPIVCVALNDTPNEASN